TPQETRLKRFNLPGIADAGWHFSYLGDERAIRTKIEAFSHQEFNTRAVKEQIADRIERSEDLFGRTGYEWKVVPLDESFPNWVRANTKALADSIADPKGQRELFDDVPACHRGSG